MEDATTSEASPPLCGGLAWAEEAFPFPEERPAPGTRPGRPFGPRAVLPGPSLVIERTDRVVLEEEELGKERDAEVDLSPPR